MPHPQNLPNHILERNLNEEVTTDTPKNSIMTHIVGGTIHLSLTTATMTADSPAVLAPKGDSPFQLLNKTLCTLLTREATR